MFDSVRATSTCGSTTRTSSRRVIVVQEWPVRAPVGYAELFAQRRPEALVILGPAPEESWTRGFLRKRYMQAHRHSLH